MYTDRRRERGPLDVIGEENEWKAEEKVMKVGKGDKRDARMQEEHEEEMSTSLR